MNAFGIDVSRFDNSADGSKLMDFEVVKAHTDPPVSFIAVRSGISWGYTDARFARSWSECKRIGVCRAAYHVIYFGESAQAQADHFMNIVTQDFDPEHDRLVLDLEVAGSNSKYQCTQTTKSLLNILKARTGLYPICYSRTGWVNEHLEVRDLPVVDWWLTQYRNPWVYPLYTPEYISPPDPLPRYVDKWLIHQTAERGKSIGGTGSYYMDYNRWNGDQSAVMKYFGFDDEVPQPPDPPLTLEEQVADNTRRIKVLEAK